MTLAAYITFISVAAALVMSPGPDFVFVLSRGLAHGWRGGVVGATGICLGLSTHTTVVLLGLGALLATSPTAFEVLKLVGAIYLAYLSVRMLAGRDLRPDELPGPGPATPTGAASVPAKKILRQGYLVNVLNPGAALTFAAFIPQFVPTESTHKTALFLLLAGSIVAFAFIWFSLTGTFAGAFTRFMRERPAVLRAMRWLLGGVLLVLAIVVLLMRR